VGTVGGTVAANEHNLIEGRIQGGIASGMLKEDTSFTWTNGTAYSCTSGVVTWTATLTK
jgi:hypothetical protein